MTTKPPAADLAASTTAGPDTDCKPVSVSDRVLTPAAQRALDEADERRKRAADQSAAAKEVGGRDGLDPVRFGDWEKGGIASDF